MQRRTVVIYHKDCWDGFGAAWIYHKHAGNPDTGYFAASYKTEPPWDMIKDNDIVIVDFSYPREQLEKIQAMASSLIIYDHHATAQRQLEGFPNAVFDMNRSGIGMIADVFERRSWLVNVVEDRDLWKFKLPGTRETIAALAIVPFQFGEWDRFFEAGQAKAILEGEGILKYIRNYGHKAWESRRYEKINGEIFPVINIQYMNCSEHLELLMNLEGVDRAASYFRRGDGFWQFSLRSRGDFDVSKIAEQFGGGGHKNAAGFEVHKLPWF